MFKAGSSHYLRLDWHKQCKVFCLLNKKKKKSSLQSHECKFFVKNSLLQSHFARGADYFPIVIKTDANTYITFVVVLKTYICNIQLSKTRNNEPCSFQIHYYFQNTPPADAAKYFHRDQSVHKVLQWNTQGPKGHIERNRKEDQRVPWNYRQWISIDSFGFCYIYPKGL